MVQFFSGASETIDDEAAREGAAVLRFQRRTGARMVNDSDLQGRMNARNVFRKRGYRLPAAATPATPGKALRLPVTDIERARAEHRRARLALQARIVQLTAHLPADEARAVCKRLMATL